MTTWEVIEAALAHRRPARDQKWLAEQLHVKPQAITNWKTRGVPAKMHRPIATLFGLSVDQVEGLEALPWASSFAWPFSSQLQERIEKMQSDEICALEKAIWERHLKEPTPAVVEQQLQKALSTIGKHELRVTDVTQPEKAAQKG